MISNEYDIKDIVSEDWPMAISLIERTLNNSLLGWLGHEFVSIFYRAFSDLDSMPAYFAAMDIMALPSYREGFGNIIIEASAMGIPVVASDIPGCRNALVDGQTGFLTQARNTASLQSALETLIEDSRLRRVLGQNGREFVCRSFDREIVWKNLLNIYDRILKSTQ